MTRRHGARRTTPAELATTLVLALTTALGVASCGDDEPGRPGGAGAPCRDNRDCPSGYCCGAKHCGDMCTFRCDRDFDCPGGMACEHGDCLFVCRGDYDCAPGQKCKHDGVCEYD